MGRRQQRGIVAKNQTKWNRMLYIEEDFVQIMELLQQRWQQNSLFINIHLGCAKTIQWELHNSNIHGRIAIAYPLIIEICAKRRKIWCDVHKTWMSDDM